MNSLQYWREREARQQAKYLKDEAEISQRIQSSYSYMLRQIEAEIAAFYARYAAAEGITLTEAKRRVAKMDVEQFASKAKRYVEIKDFSDKANAELRLYNATMKINRLELLKAMIGLEQVSGFNEIESELEDGLTDRAVQEYRRQAGILGQSVSDTNIAQVGRLINASFNNATWSERLWTQQEELRNRLSTILLRGMVQGRHPRTFIPEIRKAFGQSVYATNRLLVTEMCRVQIQSQEAAYKEYGIKKYIYIAEKDNHCCDICRQLDGKVFKVADMTIAKNAPPMHPHCRCSTAAYVE